MGALFARGKNLFSRSIGHVTMCAAHVITPCELPNHIMSGKGEEGCLEVPSREVCREMFEKVTEYLNGELAGKFYVI